MLIYSVMVNLIIAFFAQYVFLVVIVLGFLVFFFSSRTIKIYYIKLVIFTFPLSYIISKIASRAIIDPRPFIVQHMQPLIHASTDNGFPSDHMLLCMTVTSIVWVYNRKVGIMLFFVSLLVGVSRVLARVHHPLDIVGSIFIATASTLIVWFFLHKWKLVA